MHVLTAKMNEREGYEGDSIAAVLHFTYTKQYVIQQNTTNRRRGRTHNCLEKYTVLSNGFRQFARDFITGLTLESTPSTVINIEIKTLSEKT